MEKSTGVPRRNHWINAWLPILYKEENISTVPFLLIYCSGTNLYLFTFRGKYADVVELADTPDLGSGGVKPVGVRVPPSAPKNNQTMRGPTP